MEDWGACKARLESAQSMKQDKELAALREENARLRWVVKGAHGALTDTCTVVVPGGLDGDLAPAIRQLAHERDEARAECESLKERLRRERDGGRFVATGECGICGGQDCKGHPLSMPKRKEGQDGKA